MAFKSSGYKSIIPKIKPSWWLMSSEDPIVDKEAVAYGWIIKEDPRAAGLDSVMITNEAGESVLDQGAMALIREKAVLKLMAFYNKYNTSRNREVLMSNSFVKDVRVPERPKSKTLFYVLVDARAFDNTSEIGQYTEQLVADGSDLHMLAEDYLGFFMVNDRTDMGHRARIGEILKANNIDLEIADENIIETWISQVNQDSSVRTSFKEGSKINLPVLSLPEPPPAAFIITVEVGEIKKIIKRILTLLNEYDQKIVNFKGEGNTVENLDLRVQIANLNEFWPIVQRHIEFNDIMIPDVINDEIHIYLNEDYEIIYIAIDKGGEKIALLKGMPAVASSPPFNDMRTTALLARLPEISTIGRVGAARGFGDDTSGIAAGTVAGAAIFAGTGIAGAAAGAAVGATVGGVIGGALEGLGDRGVTATIPMPWESFVEEYIVPPVVIKAVDIESMFNELLESNSVVASLVAQFQKAGYKTQKDVDEEDKVMATPKIMAKAVWQSAKENLTNSDVLMANLGRIGKNMAKTALDTQSESGKRIINGVYVEVLNRISIEQLVRQAIDCLKKMMSCSELIEGILQQNFMLGYSTFKLKLPREAQYMAERAREIAQSGNFNLYDGAYSVANVKNPNLPSAGDMLGQPMGLIGGGAVAVALMATGLLGPANKQTTAARFLTVLQYGLKKETSVDYDRLLDEVCTTIMNLPDALGNFFKIPTMEFRDDLPVVDLQAAVAALLEAAIIEILVGVIVSMVQALLDTLMAGCMPDSETQPDDADYGGASMLDAIADKVGAGSIPDLLADFYDSLGDEPPRDWSDPSGDDLANEMGTCTFSDGSSRPLTRAECAAAGGLFTTGANTGSSFMDLQNESSMTGGEIRADVARKCSLIKSLLNDLSVILTPAEISALFNGEATIIVLETILEVIRLRHMELYEKVDTTQRVEAMFRTLEKISDVGSILSQIVTISRGLGCTFESNCIRQELIGDNFDGEVPPRLTNILDLLEDPTNIPTPDTFCEEKGSTIDNGLIPKDSASLLFLLKKVLSVMYDGIYMAYDAEVLRIPDSLSVMKEKDKIVPRTTLMGSSIDFDIFNFFKMQEETFTVPFPDWLPKKTVINPDFQRLVSQGFIPADGDPQGQFGPYTTEKLKLWYGTFESAPLDPVTVPEKYFIFADDSRYGLKNINKLRVGTDISPAASNSMYFALTQPFKAGGQFKPSMFSLKLSLNAAKESGEYRNTFVLQIGDIPVDPSTIPVGNQNLAPGQVTPSISFAPFSAAIYRSQLAGVTGIDRDAERVIEVLEGKSGNQLIEAGSIPQTSVLYGFVSEVTKNAGNPTGQPLKKFIYEKMYADLLLQMITGIGEETIGSPLLKSINKMRVISIIDWAPVPTDDERECDFDPHILALDTVKKRTKEAYQQYIECSPLEDEIAVAGLGRTNLSALEAAGMIGCVMTTLRAYALEQLLRSMFPVSVFAGEEFISKLTVEYIIEETLRGIKKIGQAYYDAFLEQVEFVFGLRMKEFNPFGSIPDILAQSDQIGINWMYADPAIKEFNGEVSGEQVKMEEFDSISAGVESCDDDVDGAVQTKTSIHGAKEQMVRARIRFLAEEQLYSVMPKLQDLISHTKTYEVNAGPGVTVKVPGQDLKAAVTFDDNFLNRRLPFFDIQRKPGELRLARKLEDLRTMESEELQKQYAAYLREFEEWEGSRLENLLGASFATLGDIASTMGTTTACLGKAFGMNMPPISDIEISWDVGESLDSIADFGEGVVAGLGNLSGIGDAMATCVDIGVAGGEVDLGWAGSYESPGLFGTAHRALSVVTDSPPPLETFGSGVDEGTTDRIGNLETFARGNIEGEFQLTTENGSLILEKYIKVVKKGGSTEGGLIQEASNDLSDQNLGMEASAELNFEDNPNDVMGESVPQDQPRSALSEDSMNVPTTLVANFGGQTASGLSISQLLCPREVENTSNRITTIHSDVSTDPSVGDQTNVSLVPHINPAFEQIYNIEEWEEVFAEDLRNNPNAKFGDLYESWSFGIRLVYVAPTNEFVEVPFQSAPGSAAQTLNIPSTAGTAGDPISFLFDDQIVDASRSYRQFEQIEVEQKQDTDFYTFPGAQAEADRGFFRDSVISGPEREALDEVMSSILTWDTTGEIVGAGDSIKSFMGAGRGIRSDDFQMTPFPERDSPLSGQMMADQIRAANAFQMITLERALTLFPLSEVDIPIVIGPNVNLSNILNSLKVGANKKNKDLGDLWVNAHMGKLMNHLKSSPGYKLLFKYCTPSHTIMSFASIYANLLNEMPETFFDGTKAELKKLFEILLNGGDYTFENEEEKKRGGNREQMAHAQANMGTDGSARKPGLFDLAVQTPKLIFKGLAEFLDPVIAPAAVIVKAGKAGKLLPKFIKKLDANGEETEENFLMNITVGPYDLPPPMGKFNIPLPDFLQPDGYKPAHEGLYDDPSQNISFDIPVMSFKDTITGGSLDSFVRDKLYGLRNGNAEDRELYYEFSKAIAQFNIPTVIAIVIKVYIEAMNDDSCADYMLKVNGVPIVPVPTLIFPGEKIDLPITPVALSVLPMDLLSGYGPGPPHTPLGYIYHGIVAAEALGFLDTDTKQRLVEKAGLDNKKKSDNKKKPREKLCIDIDLIREEEDRRR